MNISELTRKSEAATDLLAILANPHRLRILCELQQGERSVGALEAVIGLSQSALSQHLAKLRLAGVVATRREAQTIYYTVSDARAAKLLAVLYELFCTPAAGTKTKRKVK